MDTPYKKVLVSTNKAGMIAYLKAHPEDFREAVMLALSDEQPYAWRSAWLLWTYLEDNDPRILEYLDDILRVLPQKEDNHQRELIKIFHRVPLNESQEGRLFEHCISMWESINKKPSIRFNAFRTLTLIAGRHPELVKELRLLSQEHYLDSLAIGARRSIARMLKSLKEE